MSVLEGSIGMFPRRILVAEERVRCGAAAARRSRLRATSFGPMGAEHADVTRRRRARRPARSAPAAQRPSRRSRRHPACGGGRRRAGERLIDFGAGVGAAGLALARRVEGLTLTLVEIDPALAALARENAERNGLAERARVVCLDVTASPDAFAAAGICSGRGGSRADESAIQRRAQSVARSRPPARACRRRTRRCGVGSMPPRGFFARPAF